MMGHPITYSDAELFWIHDNHTRPRLEAHAEFVYLWDRPDVSLSNFNSLCKRKGWLTGRTGCFVKGQTPQNKGQRMPFNPNSARTQFKKGARPHNYRGAGHERVDTKDGYVVMIVDEANPWSGNKTRPVQKHRYLWEQVNGPVPEGHRLKCLDGDKTNTDPSNWEAVPMALAPRLNGRFGRGYETAPADLKPVILATAKLEHAVREARKGRK
ncbi:HNH endonuclease [Salipiger manganoxidans]|uniref:HNH endonuclease n=1 Tax=Salipiger marinus TaxID=555512 RepID=UPI001E411A05|nr:HNH endonuclease [Salipiger manganoxidans]MCD1616952.1 HNH endonuclease [Salipiger manganoxidans]